MGDPMSMRWSPDVPTTSCLPFVVGAAAAAAGAEVSRRRREGVVSGRRCWSRWSRRRWSRHALHWWFFFRPYPVGPQLDRVLMIVSQFVVVVLHGFGFHLRRVKWVGLRTLSREKIV